MILYMLGPDTRISDSFGQIHSLNTRVSTAITLHFRPKNRRLSLSLSLSLAPRRPRPRLGAVAAPLRISPGDHVALLQQRSVGAAAGHDAPFAQ